VIRPGPAAVPLALLVLNVGRTAGVLSGAPTGAVLSAGQGVAASREVPAMALRGPSMVRACAPTSTQSPASGPWSSSCAARPVGFAGS
jgi:hypothetical protein